MKENKTVFSFVAEEKQNLHSAIMAGYEAASRRSTSHLDSGTLNAQFVDKNIDAWAEMSSSELYKLEEELRPNNHWAGEVLYILARIKEPQERAAREAKTRARKERKMSKPLTHCPFAAVLGR